MAVPGVRPGRSPACAGTGILVLDRLALSKSLAVLLGNYYAIIPSVITCSHDIFSIQCTGWKCMEKHQGCRTNMNLTFKCLPLQSETLPLAQPFKNYINYIMVQFPGYTKQAKFLLWQAQSDKSIQSRRAQVNLSPGQVQTEELTQSKFLTPTQPGDPSSRVSFVPAPIQTPFLWYQAKIHPTSMKCGEVMRAEPAWGSSRDSREDTLHTRVHTEFNAIHFLDTKGVFPQVTKPKLFQPILTSPLSPRLPSCTSHFTQWCSECKVLHLAPAPSGVPHT